MKRGLASEWISVTRPLSLCQGGTILGELQYGISVPTSNSNCYETDFSFLMTEVQMFSGNLTKMNIKQADNQRKQRDKQYLT